MKVVEMRGGNWYYLMGIVDVLEILKGIIAEC